MRPSALLHDRRGIALPLALFALVVIGTLVAGVFFTARLEMKGGESAMNATRASEAAQGGLMMGVPNTLALGGSLVDGQSITDTLTQIGTSGSYYQITITRLNRYIYLVKSEGSYQGRTGVTLAKRSMAQLVKRYMPELGLNAGAIVVGGATVTGSVTISGKDSVPPGWTDCAAVNDTQAGLRVSGNANGNKLNSGTIGNPQYVQNDTTVTNMSRVMDTLFFQLASQANAVITSATVSGATPSFLTSPTRCKMTDPMNWGDNTRGGATPQCQTYFPIIYLNPGGPGNTVVVHGDGQGILLVNGDLKFNSTNTFDGLIIVRGTYIHGSGTADILGSIISQNVSLTNADFSGNLHLTYSKCASEDALKNMSVAAPSTYRGFIQF